MSIIKKYKRYFIFGVFVIFAFVGFIIKSNIVKSVSMQSPERRWSADGTHCAYVSVFFPESEGMMANTIKRIRMQHETALKEASFEKKENAHLFNDAFSYETTLSISGERNRKLAMDVNATAICGDFFYFHPMQLLSGNYLSGENTTDDRVVLDEYTAWSLYGSSDVAGKKVIINDKVFIIDGVVRPDSGKAAKKTYGKKSRIYFYESAGKKIGIEEHPVTTYELVFPDPINNYALNEVKKVFGIGDESQENINIEAVNNTTRFNFFNLWKVIREYGSRSSKTNGIIYPFWENESRRIEDFAALIQLIAMIFAAAAFVTILPDIKNIYVFLVSSVQSLIGKYRQKFS